jgi:transcription initiation factor TFIID subunit 1
MGAPNILEADAAGPFWGYGDIERGETRQVLFNNMVRAPIFPHTPSDSDFLVIKHTYKNSTRWYIREISSLFVVGQVMPAVEVAPPTSRIYTEYKRNRIRVGS